ncbi:hypothetical protein FHW69_003420 [Luteibacter sp. Sphag1AF]|uniref:hypothetical protein n=1 Tax=Luteibacter sp. Sphag1AF TaxID=2587031 RepID=UPI00160BD046|nr:hypothetical protein [Luteibacter sp. Sphag1AF]MBB3228778.1 hypothetical protein [Luteibacter sp. Sphag1AF]
MEQLIQHLPKDRRTPRLWFKQLSIFSEPDTSNIVRTVPLRRGLNVVWAKEPTAGSAVGLHAAGHGVGKTSLCLLLRYCLGDQSKTVNELRDELYGELPKGGVIAVMYVENRPFTLCRYFNSHKDGFVFAGEGAENFWDRESESSDRDFLKRLANDIVSSVSPSNIPDTGQAIEWRHLLAWISRDQGSRFKSFFTWREGEGSGLQRSRQDPPIVMRAVLGLVDQSESQLMSRIATLQQELSQASQRANELRREPALIRRRIESNLRAMGGLPDDLPIRTPDLFGDSVEGRIKVASDEASHRLAQWELKQEKADQDLAEVRAELKLRRSESERASAEYEFADAARRRDEDAFRSIGERLLKLRNLSGHCEEGNVPFSTCQYVQAEIRILELSSLRDQRDKQGLQKLMDESAGRAVGTLARKNEMGLTVQALEQQEELLKQSLNRVRTARRTAEIEANKWPGLMDELARWDGAAGSAKAQAEIDAAQAEIDRVGSELDSARTQLALLQRGKSDREKALVSITDALTQTLLPDGAFGVFDPRDEDRPFRLSMRGGEAYRVLEVLLGDIACMLDSAGSGSSHPGFLIHDCPREADMSIGLYENFFSLMNELEKNGFAGAEPPFQYIVTTTTPPPANLQDGVVRLELDPSSNEGLLFGRRFGAEQNSVLGQGKQ